MAVGNPTVRATVNQKSSATPWTFSPESQIDAGEYAVLILACDNIGSQGGVDALSSRHFVCDSKGNYWQRWVEYTNEGGSGTGASVSVWTSLVKHTLTTSDTLTAFFVVTSNRTLGAKGAVIIAGSMAAGKRLVAETTINVASADNADPASSTLSALTSREHLYLRAIGRVGFDAVTLTPTSGYTAVGGAGSGSGTTGGLSAANKGALGEWKVETSAGSTSDPATDTDTTHASVFLALYEADEWVGPYPTGFGAPAAGINGVVPGLPPGWAAGDIHVLAVESSYNEPAAAPSGWTQHPNSPQAASPGTVLSAFWRRAVAGDTAPTVADTGDHTYAVIFGFRGCPSTGDPWDVTNGGNEGATSDATLSATGLTTTVNNCFAFVVSTHMTDNADVAFTAWASANLAFLDEKWDQGTALGNGGGIGVVTGEKASAGAFGPTTATTPTTGHTFISLAFKLGATIVALEQATETDISQVLGRALGLEQLAESDTANAITARKVKEASQATEVDLVQILGRAKGLEQPTEADAAQTVTACKTYGTGVQTTETDTVGAITRLAGYTVTVGQTTETDASRALGRALGLEQALETDTSNATAVNPQRRLVEQTAEADTAWFLGRGTGLEQLAEADIANAVIVNPQRRLAGQTTETDIVDAATVKKTGTVSQTTETDSTDVVTQRKTKEAGQLAEADLAQPLTHSRGAVLGQPTEADTVGDFTSLKVKSVNQVTEVDTAQSINVAGKLDQSLEADLAQGITSLKLAALGQVTESNSVQDITVKLTKRIAVDASSEVDLAQLLTCRRGVALGQSIEVDASRDITSYLTFAVESATEADSARDITCRRAVTIPAAVEIDTASDVTYVPGHLLNQVLETDTAQGLTIVRRRRLNAPREADTASFIWSGHIYVSLDQLVEYDWAKMVAVPGTMSRSRVLEAVVASNEYEFGKGQVAEYDLVPASGTPSSSRGGDTVTDSDGYEAGR